MQKTFNVYSDPGHGWAKVPHSLLFKMGIADKISLYSHQRGNFAYLEEDGDLSLFINEFRSQFKCDPVFRETYTDRYSKIRNYVGYIPPKGE